MELTPYTQLAQLLEDLSVPLANKRSGTFFIATDDNASCRFAISDGEITHCCIKRLHGPEAIQAIQAGLRGRGKFSENNKSFFRDSDKVEHSDVVEQLGLNIATSKEAIIVDDEPAPEVKKQVKRMYRGKEVIVEEPVRVPQQNTTKKPARMYRGQVLDD